MSASSVSGKTCESSGSTKKQASKQSAVLEGMEMAMVNSGTLGTEQQLGQGPVCWRGENRVLE